MASIEARLNKSLEDLIKEQSSIHGRKPASASSGARKGQQQRQQSRSSRPSKRAAGGDAMDVDHAGGKPRRRVDTGILNAPRGGISKVCSVWQFPLGLRDEGALAQSFSFLCVR